jgi:ribonuclease E
MTVNRNNIHVRSEAGGRDTGLGNPFEGTSGRTSGEEEIRDFGAMELDEQVTEASSPRRGEEGAEDNEEDDDDIEDVDFELDDEDLDDVDNLDDEDDTETEDTENLNDQHNDESTSHMDYNGNSNESRPNR